MQAGGRGLSWFQSFLSHGQVHLLWDPLRMGMWVWGSIYTYALPTTSASSPITPCIYLLIHCENSSIGTLTPMLKKMHRNLHNINLWHKTVSNQKLDHGKA